MSEVLTKISEAVIDGNFEEMVDLTEDALDEGLTAQQILDGGLMAGMDYVGVEFKAGNMFVPEVLRSARSMQAAMDILKPLLVAAGAKRAGRVLLGTVKGDLHDIGKNLVGMMWEGAGFEVHNLGINVDADKFIAAIKEHNANLLGMSALLTTTMPYMLTVIQRLKEEGLRARVKVLVGGAPLNAAFAEDIEADVYCRDAAEAVAAAKALTAASLIR